jgi:hypothetical protein
MKNVALKLQKIVKLALISVYLLIAKVYFLSTVNERLVPDLVVVLPGLIFFLPFLYACSYVFLYLFKPKTCP